ncbi:ribonuclease H-like domain-containing protein [Tanacetum coccineum]
MQQPPPNNKFVLQPSFNTNYMQQLMPNPDEINDPTTTINMGLVLMAKAFKLKYSIPTNNIQRISSNPCNRQIAQPGMNMVGGIQNVYNVVQNKGNQVVQNPVQNLAARAKENGNGNNGYIEEIEEVSANCILMANLQQASSLDTQVDKASIYDSDGSAEVPKPVPNSKQRFHLLHMDLCGPMRVKSINGKWYVLVIVGDYSRYTWVHFLRSKDDTPEVIKTSLKKMQLLLQALVIIIRTDNGT